MKEPYCVKLNWSGEVHSFQTKAQSENEALNKCIAALALKVGYTRWAVKQRLNHNNIEVRKEP